MLAQGHKAVTPVRLEPAAPLSQVKHFTTEPLCTLTEVAELWDYFKLVPPILVSKLCPFIDYFFQNILLHVITQ